VIKMITDDMSLDDALAEMIAEIAEGDNEMTSAEFMVLNGRLRAVGEREFGTFRDKTNKDAFIAYLVGKMNAAKIS
jgi:hypothetical protein